MKPESQSIKETHIYIRVRRDLLQAIPTDGGNPTTGHLYLIKGTMQDIGRYAGTTVNWVIRLAHMICSPMGVGQVYTHTEGTAEDWLGRDKGTDWRQVHPGDPLLPGVYQFESSVPVVLSRLSSRQSHSKTSSGSKSNSSTFCQLVTERDGDTCVATSAPSSLVASHLIPKRMGTDGAKAVVAQFVGEQAAIHVHKFHPMIGVLLFCSLSERVDQYILGFYHNTVSVQQFYHILNLSTVTRVILTLFTILTSRGRIYRSTVVGFPCLPFPTYPVFTRTR